MKWFRSDCKVPLSKLEFLRQSSPFIVGFQTRDNTTKNPLCDGESLEEILCKGFFLGLSLALSAQRSSHRLEDQQQGLKPNLQNSSPQTWRFYKLDGLSDMRAPSLSFSLFFLSFPFFVPGIELYEFLFSLRFLFANIVLIIALHLEKNSDISIEFFSLLLSCFSIIYSSALQSRNPVFKLQFILTRWI